MVIGGIDACGNEIRGHCMSSFVTLSHSGEKLVKGQLWAEVTQVTIWGHMRVLPSMPQVIFLFECHISSVTLLQSKR